MTDMTGTSAQEQRWANVPAARLLGACRRLQQRDRSRPWLLDTLLVAAVLAAFGLPDLLHSGIRSGTNRVDGLPTVTITRPFRANPKSWPSRLPRLRPSIVDPATRMTESEAWTTTSALRASVAARGARARRG